MTYSLFSAFFVNRLSFAHTDDVYSLMENVVTVAVPEIQSSDNNGISTTYPSLNRFFHFLSFVYNMQTDDVLNFVTFHHISYFGDNMSVSIVLTCVDRERVKTER